MRRPYALAILVLIACPAIAQVQRFPLPRPNTFLIDVLPARDGRIWVAGASSLWRLDPDMTMVEFPSGLTFHPETLSILSDGGVWFSGDGRLSRHDPNSGAITHQGASFETAICSLA